MGDLLTSDRRRARASGNGARCYIPPLRFTGLPSSTPPLGVIHVKELGSNQTYPFFCGSNRSSPLPTRLVEYFSRRTHEMVALVTATVRKEEVPGSRRSLFYHRREIAGELLREGGTQTRFDL